MIRSPNHNIPREITKSFNEHVCIEGGEVRKECKEANIINPQAGKYQNLRPISLALCMGKLFDKVIQIIFRSHIKITDYSRIPCSGSAHMSQNKTMAATTRSP